jgi:hypothetical protein
MRPGTMRLDFSRLLSGKSQPPQLAAVMGKPRKPRSKAILMNEMADSIVKRVFGKKGKELTREQMLQAIDDNMLLAAMAISERLAKQREKDEEDKFELTDTLQMFKQLREFQMAQARIGKIDPSKDKDKDKTPEGIAGYQSTLATDKKDFAEKEDAARITAEGKPDKRHQNTGRPPGEGLKKQQERIRKQQAKLLAQEQPEANALPSDPEPTRGT